MEAVEEDGLQEVRKIASFHDEPLKSDRQGQRSIRLTSTTSTRSRSSRSAKEVCRCTATCAAPLTTTEKSLRRHGLATQPFFRIPRTKILRRPTSSDSSSMLSGNTAKNASWPPVYATRNWGSRPRLRASTTPIRKNGTCTTRLWPVPIPHHVRFHDLRHTTATLLLKAGVPLEPCKRSFATRIRR